MIGTEISECGRTGGALRKVRLAIEHLDIGRRSMPDVPRRGIAAKAAQQVCYRFRITESAEETLHARFGDGGEEIMEVHFQNDQLANVRRAECVDGTAFAKAVDGIVQRD